MIRAFKLSPFVICTTVSLLVIGELASGTSLYFAAMMAIAMLSIGIAYNLLGGLATFGGMMFTSFALRTIVISQFAKVLLFEAADKNLEVPQLTISIFAVFYLSALVGIFLFGNMRFRLPKPMEPTSSAHSRGVYLVSLVVGLTATTAFEISTQAYGGGTQYGGERSVGLAFAPLLLFSLVIAVDAHIRNTNGRHSFDLAAFIPWAAATLFGFIDTVRGTMLMPTIAYFAICYLRGYRFKKRHFATLGVVFLAFNYFIGPLELFTRNYSFGQPFNQRVYLAFHILATHHNPVELRNAAQQAAESGEGAVREQYYSRPGTYQLSRFSLIRADSTLISACSNGFHYGFTAINITLLQNIPAFLYKNKPRDVAGEDYLARVSGLGGDNPGVLHPAISAVADSYGAFGWMGVILVPFLFFPLTFIVYESMFDMQKPWGTVAFAIGVLGFGEVMVMRFVGIIVRLPLLLVLLSFLVGGLVKMVPMRGDREVGLRAKSPGKVGDDHEARA